MTRHHHWIPFRVSVGLGCVVLLIVFGAVCCVAHGAERFEVTNHCPPAFEVTNRCPPKPTAAPPAAITYSPPAPPVYYLVGGRLYTSPPSYHLPAFGSGTACVPGGG